MVRAVFPDIPQAAIVADLQRTGSVEATIDNALRDGGLPMVRSLLMNCICEALIRYNLYSLHHLSRKQHKAVMHRLHRLQRKKHRLIAT